MAVFAVVAELALVEVDTVDEVSRMVDTFAEQAVLIIRGGEDEVAVFCPGDTVRIIGVLHGAADNGEILLGRCRIEGAELLKKRSRKVIRASIRMPVPSIGVPGIDIVDLKAAVGRHTGKYLFFAERAAAGIEKAAVTRAKEAA